MILDLILDQLKQTDASIELNTRVESINYETGEVRARKDGKELGYRADYVISSVSIGVLRNKADLF